MKARVTLDKRSDFDKKWDKLWNDLCRSARLTPIQSGLVSRYLREIIGMRIHEIEAACDMAWLTALIESENFGTDVSRGAKKLLRVQRHACEVRNEAYGKECIDANGRLEYDGCGLEHLKVRLARYNVDYDINF